MGWITVKEACAELGISDTAFYDYFRRIDENGDWVLIYVGGAEKITFGRKALGKTGNWHINRNKFRYVKQCFCGER